MSGSRSGVEPLSRCSHGVFAQQGVIAKLGADERQLVWENVFIDEHLVADRRVPQEVSRRHRKQISLQLGVAFGPIRTKVPRVSELTYRVIPLLKARGQLREHTCADRSIMKASAIHRHPQRIPGRAVVKPMMPRGDLLRISPRTASVTVTVPSGAAA
jgi:hypothetical protein